MHTSRPSSEYSIKTEVIVVAISGPNASSRASLAKTAIQISQYRSTGHMHYYGIVFPQGDSSDPVRVDHSDGAERATEQ